MAHVFLDQTSQTRCYVADVSQVKTILPKPITVDGTATASNALCFDIEFPDAVMFNFFDYILNTEKFFYKKKLR